MAYKKEFIFDLETPITYLTSNEHTGKAVIKKILLRAPTPQDGRISDDLTQKIVRAMSYYFQQQVKNLAGVDINKISSMTSQKDTAKLNLSFMILTALMNSNESLYETKQLFAELLLNGHSCLLESKYTPTQLNIESIEPKEFQKMMGEYFVNFILPEEYQEINAS